MSNNKFKVKFRGTRGSHPVCKQNFLKYGANTSCVELKLGDRLVVLDSGTGIIDLGNEIFRDYILSANNIEDRKNIKSTIVLSHIHQDHIQGLQFYKPLFMANSIVDIYSMSIDNQKPKDTLSDLLFNKVFPLSLEDSRAKVDISAVSESKRLIINQSNEAKVVDVVDFDKDDYCKDDVIISFYKTHAHPKNGCLCIKISYNNKTLVYATDKESYVGSDKRFVEFAHGCDVLIHDSQYTHQDYVSPVAPKQGFGHSTYQMAIETAKLAKAKKLFFFHYDPEYDDTTLDLLKHEMALVDANAEFSYEGLEIVL